MNTKTIRKADAMAAMRRAAAVAWDEGYANGRNDDHLDSSEPTPNPYRTADPADTTR